MNNLDRLEPLEIHELAIAYAHAKVLDFIKDEQSPNIENEINYLVKTYKRATELIPHEEIRDII